MELKPKKIAILCDYALLPERIGGMDYFFWELDAKCKENNIQIDWFFPNKSNHGEYGKLTIFGSENCTIECFFLDYCSRNTPKYELVITHFLELCTPFFKEIKLLSNSKIIVIDHNPRPLKGYPLKKKIQKRVKGFLYSKYIDTFIGVSDYTKQELIKDFGFQIKDKTQVVYNGIALDDIQLRHERNKTKPRFLTASHLRESKGIQDLIQAVFILPKIIRDEIVIDIYGDGPYRQQLQNQVQNLELQKCFNFKGSSANLKSVYCDYDYMLQPTHMECFSLSILESLAANVPVITTSVGGNTEVITDDWNGYIIQPKNKEVLRDIIQSIYLGEKKILINTRPLIENHFSIKKMLENHLALILE